MKKFFAAAVVLIITTAASAQTSFEYEQMGRLFAQRGVGQMRPMNDGVRYTNVSGGMIRSFRYVDGDVADTIVNTLQSMDWLKMVDYELSADETKVLLKYNVKPLYRRTGYANYAVYDRKTKRYSLVSEHDSLRTALISPRSDAVLYVWRNNIYIQNLKDERTTAVTTDGVVNKIINGMPDWVYEEEFAVSRLVKWSPDGKRIAYLKSDESRVREYQIPFYTRSTDPYPAMYSYKYPKAGEANSVVSLHIYDTTTGRTITVDAGSDVEKYIPYFEWTPDGSLYLFRIDRPQQKFQILLSDVNGKCRTIYSEQSDKYVEVDNLDSSPVYFLSDGRRFIIRNETATGYWHLYLYDIYNGLQKVVTQGNWEVKEIIRVTDKHIWYVSNEGSPLRSGLWSIDIDGQNKRQITTAQGTHRIASCNSDNYFVDYFSNTTTPNRITLISSSGKIVRTLEDNAPLKARIDEMQLPVKEIIEVKLPDAGICYGYIIKPNGFDAAKKYPVLITQYSGPGSQSVSDSWGTGWEDALVQKGYIVACLDPRGTGGRGEAFKKSTYGHLGEDETIDQINFARYLARLPFVDGGRIGIYGWSYGGFMALNCILQGADVFKTAISVAPLSSWRYYDSVYTERYNGNPNTNSAGYDRPSPITYASRLKGNLLLIHGTADDNVHYQNSATMAAALVKAGKQFEFFSFPDDNHSMYPTGRAIIYRKMIDYCLTYL